MIGGKKSKEEYLVTCQHKYEIQTSVSIYWFLFLNWNTTPIHVHTEYGCFCPAKAKLNSFNRNCTIKPKLFAISPITRNVHSHLVQTNFICIYKSTVVFRRSIIQGQRVNSKDSVRPILRLHPASQHSFAHIWYYCKLLNLPESLFSPPKTGLIISTSLGCCDVSVCDIHSVMWDFLQPYGL